MSCPSIQALLRTRGSNNHPFGRMYFILLHPLGKSLFTARRRFKLKSARNPSLAHDAPIKRLRWVSQVISVAIVHGNIDFYAMIEKRLSDKCASLQRATNVLSSLSVTVVSGKIISSKVRGTKRSASLRNIGKP